MATKNGKANGAVNDKVNDLQQFLKGQLDDAQKRFVALEKDAEKVLNQLVVRGETTLKTSRKEIEGLLTRINTADLRFNAVFDHPAVKQLGKRADQARNDLRKRLDGLQTKVVEATGVASQQQVKELKGELSRLSKKIDALVGKKAPAKTDVSAQ